jgi:hypothetical protein
MNLFEGVSARNSVLPPRHQGRRPGLCGRRLMYQMRPCGGGVVDLTALLAVIADASPEANLTRECEESTHDRPDARFQMLVALDDEDSLRAHLDLTIEELVAYLRLVSRYEERLRVGEVVDPVTYGGKPFGGEEALTAIPDSVAHLRSACITAGLPLRRERERIG